MSRIDHLLIHRATIVDVKRTAGSGGAWPEGRALRASNVPCMRAPASSSEQDIALHRGAIVTHSVWFQLDQEIEKDDELVIDGTTYIVRIPSIVPSRAIYKKSLVEERITGA